MTFIGFLALLSINLGFINLLPVPLMDGGHLFFYTIEAVRRRPLSANALEWAFRGGFALIVTLMLFLTISEDESSLLMPPPRLAKLLLTTLSLNVSVPALKMPPPEPLVVCPLVMVRPEMLVANSESIWNI